MSLTNLELKVLHYLLKLKDLVCDGFWENAGFLKHVLWKILSLLTYADEILVLVTSFASILHEKSKILSTTFPQWK